MRKAGGTRAFEQGATREVASPNAPKPASRRLPRQGPSTTDTKSVLVNSTNALYRAPSTGAETSFGCRNIIVKSRRAERC